MKYRVEFADQAKSDLFEIYLWIAEDSVVNAIRWIATLESAIRQLRRCARSASGSSSQEVPLNWNTWIRQTHRWLSIAFTVAVIVTFVALAQKEPVVWVSYVPLAPLALLWLTGMYLFVLPYATKWRSGRPSQDRKTAE
jgi:plasmid stabilization system protein ParE